MKDWIVKYWLQVLFTFIVSGIVLNYKKLSYKIKTKNNEQELIKLGIQALLRASIIQNYNHYQDKGYCPIYALENVNALYTQYHALGGNGMITELMEKIKDLPTEKKEE